MADNRFSKYAAPASQGIQVRGPDQKLPGELAIQGSNIVKSRNEAAASGYDPAKAAADLELARLTARIKEIEAGSAGAKSAADLEQSRLAIKKLEAEIAKIQTGKNKALQALQTQVDDVTGSFNQNIQGGLPNVFNVITPDFLQPEIGAFDSAAQGLTNPFLSAFRVEGQGSQSDTELRQFIAANVPSQGDSDAVVQQKLKNIQTRIDAETGTPRQNMDSTSQFVGGAGEPAAAVRSSRDTKSVQDPFLRGIGQKVGSMLSAGKPDAEIVKFLRDNGVPPESTSINSALQERRKPYFQQWKRQNPGAPYPLGPSFYTKEVPLTGAQKTVNDAAQSVPGAFAISAGNAVTGGRLDNIAETLGGNGEAVRTGMQVVRSDNPVASFVGDLTGQVLAEAIVGRIPGAGRLLSTPWGRRGADALYGAYAGSGEADGNAVMGAITGAGANLAGGVVGRNAQRGIGGAFTGVRNANIGYLDKANVPMTIGQIARGTETKLGNAIGGIEERAMGLPGLDAIIGGARRRGDEGFNRAAWGEIGVDAIGSAGVADGQSAVNQAYSFLDNANIPLDAQYAGRNAMVRADLPSLPNFGPQVGKSLDRLDIAAQGGALSGRDWQSGVRTTRSNAASIRGKEFSDDAANSLKEVQSNLMDLAARQGPSDSAQQLASANALNAKYSTLVDALDNGPAQRAGELFSASRLNDASRTNARNFGGQVNSMKGNRPFYSLAKAGMAAMPNLTPDSGSIGRLALIPVAGATIGGASNLLGSDPSLGGVTDDAGSGLTKGLLATALLSAPYSKTGQTLLQRALVGQRPDKFIRLGGFLKRNAKQGGRVGAAALRDLVNLPEL